MTRTKYSLDGLPCDVFQRYDDPRLQGCLGINPTVTYHTGWLDERGKWVEVNLGNGHAFDPIPLQVVSAHREICNIRKAERTSHDRD